MTTKQVNSIAQVASHFSLVIDELIEFNVESKSAKLLVDPLQLVEYFSRVTPRFVLIGKKGKIRRFIKSQLERTNYFKFGARYRIRVFKRSFAADTDAVAGDALMSDFSLHHSTWRS